MFEIIKNAQVDTKLIWVKGEPSLQIVIDNRYVHDFKAGSRESKYCSNTDIETIRKMFSGGTYFFYQDRLVDYRLSSYNGFTHDHDGISELVDRIGIGSPQNLREASIGGLFNQHRSNGNNGIFLGGEWDKFDLNISELGIGGEFNNQLIYRWSPFSSNIITSLEIERLVCTNGMVSSSPFVSFEVPLINDWERNLHVISAQLKPRINDLLTMRFKDMADNRSSVNDIARANSMLKERYSVTETPELVNMLNITDLKSNLGSYFHEELFTDSAKSKMVGGHLTQFDVFNILTEASSHYGNDIESNFQIQRELNRLVFGGIDQKKQLNLVKPVISDSDHRRAFFGNNK